MAFHRFFEWLAASQFDSRDEAESFITTWLKMEYNEIAGFHVFPELSQKTNYITYGVLNGMSADHEKDPLTLEDLSGEFGVSRERIRQIEVRAFEKVQKAVQSEARRGEMPSIG